MRYVGLMDKYDIVTERITKKLNEYIYLDVDLEKAENVLSSSSRLGRLFIQGAQYVSVKRFESFLKGLGQSSDISHQQLEKLEKYVSNEKRARFICEQLDKVIKANSTRASMMMGLLLNKVMNYSENPSFRDLIIINTLSELYDEDIENLKYILNECSSNFSVSVFVDQYSREMWINYFEEKNSNYEELSYTFEKAMKFQLLQEIPDPMNNQEFDLEPYSKPEYRLKITQLGKDILELIERTEKIR